MHGQARQSGEQSAMSSPSAGRLRRRGAITWIDRHRAVVVKTTPEGSVEVGRVERDVPGDGRTYLARIAHEIGDQDRVVVVGPWPERTELERAYVAIYQRPDRLVDVEPAGPLEASAVDEPTLVEALRTLASNRL